MNDIFQEVDDAMRQEKLQKIWSEYKATIITAIIILIATTALGSAYKAWDHNKNAVNTEKLSMALNSENKEEALTDFIPSARAQHRAMAQLALVDLYFEQKDKESALALLSQMVKKGSTPKFYRDQARLLFFVHSDANQDVDVLKPVIARKKSPFTWHARIEASGFYAEQGDFDQAIKLLKPFEAETLLPAKLKKQASDLLFLYEYDQQALQKALMAKE